MPDRYWRGGTAAWDGTAGSKWADSPGGATGASVPTSADDVYFDATSTGTCTISTGNTGAKSINCTGFTGTLAGTVAISVVGSVTLVAGMNYTHTGTMTFTGTGTLTTAGKTFSAITVNGSGITLTLGDALNMGNRTVTFTQGTFDTGNYSVTAGNFSSSGAAAKTVTLGSSTINLSGGSTWNIGSVTTLNAGTSQINLTSVGNFNGEGKTYYNVSYIGNIASSEPTGATSYRRTVLGANTFNNLTFTAPTSGIILYLLNANQTVNGTFTCSSPSTIGRCFVYTGIAGLSPTIGTTRTITATAVSANNCDFRDITIAGGAAGVSPIGAGDCGGNSGITFPVGKTVYRVGTNTTWRGSSSWALTSGSTGSNDNFPLAQDTAVINNDTALTGTLTLDFGNYSALDCSNRTTAITLAYNSINNWHGSHTLGPGVTVSGATAQNFFGRTPTIDFTSNGKTITFPIVVEAIGRTFRLGDAFNGSTITHNRGTFDANNYNLTCVTFGYSVGGNAPVRTITMGSGLWTLTGTGTVWDISTTSNLTFNKNTANILLSNTTTSARAFNGLGLSYNKLTIGGTSGTSILTIGGGANSFTELASTKTVAHTIRFSSNQGTIDTWSVTGTLDNVVTVDSSVVSTRRTFTLTNVTTGINYLSVRDIGCNNANRFYVGPNSTDNGNNSNVIFTDPPVTTATGNMFVMF